MSKYLSVPDFHFSSKWGEISKQVMAAIIKAAKDNHVDFVSFVGDTFNEPIVNSNKGGINDIRAMFKELLSYCSVTAIEGTPSHDGPGCYGVLEDLGVVLLKPNHTYGFARGAIFDTSNTATTPECILFGVPELSKKLVQAKLQLSADSATSTTLELFKGYVASYISPMRLKYKDIPAYGFLHGNVSDSHQENCTDIVLRSSDLVIYTEDLRPADLTRWEFGHIHTPWESEVINGGYAGFTGIDSNPWGKRDFVPSMDLVDNDTVTRIPYGTPKRVKIPKPLDNYDANTAYWLFTKDPKATLPEIVHPWSRVTFNEQTKATRRVTEEEAKKVKKLSDLLTLLDPDATDKAKELIDTIPTYDKKQSLNVNVALQSVEVKGCKFFNGNTVKFNLSTLSNTVTELRGDNGSGKSSLLAFCTPYPIIVGKDTQNRDSAIGEFFNQKDSSIHKVFLVNGHVHDHLINIKGAHTKTSKNECYLTIDGKAQLDKGTFDEMFAMCEKLYGTFSDYVLTSFYVQPLQSKKLSSGLMSADMKDVRNLVQNIAGIDREKEKAYALAQRLELDNKSVKLENWIQGSKDNLIDVDSVKQTIANKNSSITDKNNELASITEKGKQLAEDKKKLDKVAAQNEVEKQKETSDRTKLAELKNKKEELEKSITGFKELALQATSIRENIENNNKNYEANNSRFILVDKNNKLKASYDKKHAELEASIQTAKFDVTKKRQEVEAKNNTAKFEYQRQKNALQAKIDKLEREYNSTVSDAKIAYENKQKQLTDTMNQARNAIKIAKSNIVALNKPCPQCGYIAPDIKSQIAELEAEIKSNMDKGINAKAKFDALVEPNIDIPEELKLIKFELDNIKEPESILAPQSSQELRNAEKALSELATPEYVSVPDVLPVLSDSEIKTLQDKLSDINVGNSKIAEYQAQIATITSDVETLEHATYNYDPNLDSVIKAKESEIEELRNSYTDIKESIATIKAEIASAEGEIQRFKEQRSTIDGKERELEQLKATSKVWDYLAKMLNPNKIPALELEMMLSSIDAEATRIIESYQDGRFTFETQTQNERGSDKFDIMVFDGMTGDKRSFMKFSVGQKCFLSDAYTKALVRERNSNGTRLYSPVIMDESDGPLQPELVGAYYEIQKNYWNVPVLAVSHNPTSHEYLESRVDIKDLME